MSAVATHFAGAPRRAGNVLLLDEGLGRRVRRRRRLMGMTQATLAAACGTTFQQIQKYESGQSSMYATRLWEIAKALDTPITYFSEAVDPRPPEPHDVPLEDWTAEALELARAFVRLDEVSRRRLLDLAQAMTRDRAAPVRPAWGAQAMAPRRRSQTGGASR